jgi:hypothetical protein
VAVSVTLAIASRRAHAVVGGRARGSQSCSCSHRRLPRDQRAQVVAARPTRARSRLLQEPRGGSDQSRTRNGRCGHLRPEPRAGAIVRRTRGENFITAKVALRTLEQSRQKGFSSQDR